MRKEVRTIAWLVVLTLVPLAAAAEVARVEIASRRDVLAGRAFGSTGPYEVIVGKIHFVVDPANPRNKVVMDLDKAPRNAAGMVELAADLSILRPKDAVQGNGVTNVAPRSPVYSTRVDAGISGLRLNGGGRRVFTPNGDGVDDRLRLTWTNHRRFDSLALRVYRSDGRLVDTRTLPVGKWTPGGHRFDWDGTLGGIPLPAGIYVIQLQGTVGSTTFSAASASPVSPAQLARWGVVVRWGSS